jgi:hypothetical protein
MRIRYGKVNGRTRRSARKSRDAAGAREGIQSGGGDRRRRAGMRKDSVEARLKIGGGALRLATALAVTLP